MNGGATVDQIGIRIGYSALMLLTIIVAFLLLRKNQRKLPLTPSQRASLALAAFIGTMIGAKLPFFGEQGIEGIASGSIWFADGKTILGGIFGGYFTIEMVKWFQGIRVSTGDSFALPVAIAVFMGRIGCFIGGCCFGTITDLPWGIHFSAAGDPPNILRHPTQLYEAAFHLLAAALLIVAQQYKWWPGQKLKVYLLAYLGYRFISEWIRPADVAYLWLTNYQLASLGLAACLIGLWFRDERTAALQSNVEQMSNNQQEAAERGEIGL